MLLHELGRKCRFMDFLSLNFGLELFGATCCPFHTKQQQLLKWHLRCKLFLFFHIAKFYLVLCLFFVLSCSFLWLGLLCRVKNTLTSGCFAASALSQIVPWTCSQRMKTWNANRAPSSASLLIHYSFVCLFVVTELSSFFYASFLFLPMLSTYCPPPPTPLAQFSAPPSSTPFHLAFPTWFFSSAARGNWQCHTDGVFFVVPHTCFWAHTAAYQRQHQLLIFLLILLHHCFFSSFFLACLARSWQHSVRFGNIGLCFSPRKAFPQPARGRRQRCQPVPSRAHLYPRRRCAFPAALL